MWLAPTGRYIRECNAPAPRVVAPMMLHTRLPLSHQLPRSKLLALDSSCSACVLLAQSSAVSSSIGGREFSQEAEDQRCGLGEHLGAVLHRCIAVGHLPVGDLHGFVHGDHPRDQNPGCSGDAGSLRGGHGDRSIPGGCVFNRAPPNGKIHGLSSRRSHRVTGSFRLVRGLELSWRSWAGRRERTEHAGQWG